MASALIHMAVAKKVNKILKKAKELVASKGMYLDSSVIAHPDQRMIDKIL